ncbi:MAG: hypothetical protein GF317_08680 [Candidatus Lokiarchaeota archaeon]|nr:hypothetical protein [Candidatus Lokiarchaeota archaeon]MBD3199790.1 hypothetical protein [Candidatus Lokiarchaeota archaeon]
MKLERYHDAIKCFNKTLKYYPNFENS